MSPMSVGLGIAVFAAKHKSEAEEVASIFLVVICVIASIVMLIRESTATYRVVIRNGLPYCPRCNRQVSYRRDVCRACGYALKVYSQPASPPAPPPPKSAEQLRLEALQAEEQRKQRVKQEEDRQVFEEERRLQAEERLAARHKYYRSRGIEPGPLAWFWVLPEWIQAVSLGAVLSLPVLVAAFLYARQLK